MIGNARVNPCVIASPERHGVSLWQDLVIKETDTYSAHSCALSCSYSFSRQECFIHSADKAASGSLPVHLTADKSGRQAKNVCCTSTAHIPVR